MSIIKATSPLEQQGQQFYPLTTYDQIILPDGSRWTGSNKVQSVNGKIDKVNLTYEDVGAASAEHNHSQYCETSNFIYSDTEPTGTAVGQIWLKPVT